jgi:DNA-binding Xre family transcriptional regulator
MRIKLKELMQDRGWTAGRVVEATGLNLATVYRLREQSVGRIDERSLVAIARAFDVQSLEELIEVKW